MESLTAYLIDQHRGQLRTPHKPRGEGKRSRFPRLWPRFNYRESRTRKRGGKP